MWELTLIASSAGTIMRNVGWVRGQSFVRLVTIGKIELLWVIAQVAKVFGINSTSN